MIAPTASAIAIAGAGAVAQALGQRLHAQGARITALAARGRPRARQAAAFIDASVEVVGLAELAGKADRLILAVSDRGIAEVAGLLAGSGMRASVALHTSGATGLAPMAPLRASGVACGVFHPLQTIATPEQGARSLDAVAFGICGDPAAVEWATELAGQVGGWALPVPEEGLAAYHASAVMTSNAIDALIDAALQVMALAGIDQPTALKALAPLGRTTEANIVDHGPEAALTGPVARGDLGTVRAHLDTLASAPASVASLYRAAALHLVDVARRRGLHEERARELLALLVSGPTGDAG